MVDAAKPTGHIKHQNEKYFFLKTLPNKTQQHHGENNKIRHGLFFY